MKLGDLIVELIECKTALGNSRLSDRLSVPAGSQTKITASLEDKIKKIKDELNEMGCQQEPHRLVPFAGMDNTTARNLEDIQVTPGIIQSREDFEANHRYDEAKDNSLTE